MLTPPRLFTASARIKPWGDKWCVLLNGKRLVGHDGEGFEKAESELLLEKVELEAQRLAGAGELTQESFNGET